MASIGIEWVNKYNGHSSNLYFNKLNAEGFYNLLNGTRSFNYGNDSAWDQDFEQQGKGSPVAGTDHVYVDTVDIAYFSGHGSPSGIYFGVYVDNRVASPPEMQLGDIRAKWIVLDACETLRMRPGYPTTDAIDRWKNVFNGLRYILGFHTTCVDLPFRGERFALYLNLGFKIKDAWIQACKETEWGSTQWAYLRAYSGSVDTANDKWTSIPGNKPTGTLSFHHARGYC